MAFKREEREGNVVLRIEGPMTIYEAVDIRNELIKCFDDADNVTLDLDAVSDCDTAGVQLLCAVRKTGNEDGKTFCVERLSKAVADAITRAGMALDEWSNNRVGDQSQTPTGESITEVRNAQGYHDG